MALNSTHVIVCVLQKSEDCSIHSALPSLNSPY